MGIESEARKAARMEDIDQSGEDALGGNNSERGGNSESDAGSVDDSFGDSTITTATELCENNTEPSDGDIFSSQRLSLW